MKTKTTRTKSRSLQKAFTLLEAMSVAIVLGVVASVAYLATSSTVQRAKDVKLRADVDALNRAVQVYIANGGDVATAADSNDVIARLKTKLNDEDAKRFVGLTSSMSDVRVKAIYQTPEEAATEQLRAVWDPSERKFVLGNAGDAAIKQFVLDDEQATGESEIETRSHVGGFMYALDDEWIWDFEDRPELAATQVTTVSIYFQDWGDDYVPPSTTPTDYTPDPGPTDPGTPVDPNAPPMLTPPTFTPEEGKYIYTEFPFTVTLTEGNPENMATIRYAINEGSFQTYRAPFQVAQDDVVRAYCASRRPALFRNSQEVDAFYESVEQLFAGQASGRWNGGHRSGESPATYTVRNNNGHGNNADGVDSSNPGQGGGGPNGEVDPSGDFDDEINTGGGNTFTSSVTYNTSANVSYYEEGGYSVFQWGTSANSSPPNKLRFQGSTIVNIEPEQLFRVGQLHYYNGAVYSGTEAHTVTLNVDLAMTTPAQNDTFPFTFSLENTTNRGVSANADADYVRIQSRAIPMDTELNGKQYYLVLEFGDVTSNGFSSVNQFHVHENKSAMTSLYGYFTENPPAGLESIGNPGSGSGTTPPPAPAVTLAVSDPSTSEGGNLSFVATLSSASTTDTVITYSTSGGTATAPGDYSARTAQTLTIPAGQTSRTITVPTVDDNVVELSETVILNYAISSGNVTSPATSATGTITNSDNSTLTVAGATVAEGGTLSFAVSLSSPVDVATSITYLTADGSASASGSDYTPKSEQTLVIPAGQTTATITVQTTADNTVEADEFFYLDYGVDASGRAVAGAAAYALGNITNDDTAVLSIANASVVEGGTLHFNVTLSKPVDTNILVSYDTENGTAGSNDYTKKNNWSLTIPAGQTTGFIQVATKSDNRKESNETIRLEYQLESSGRSVNQASTYATGTIIDND